MDHMLLTYKGRRYMADDKISETFQSHGEPDERFSFRPKTRLYFQIGRTYKVPTKDGTTFSLGDSVRLDDIQEHPDTALWRTEDQAAAQELEGERARKKMEREAKDDNREIGDLTLREFRDLLRGAHASRRGALITVLNTYMARSGW